MRPEFLAIHVRSNNNYINPQTLRKSVSKIYVYNIHEGIMCIYIYFCVGCGGLPIA